MRILLDIAPRAQAASFGSAGLVGRADLGWSFRSAAAAPRALRGPACLGALGSCANPAPTAHGTPVVKGRHRPPAP